MGISRTFKEPKVVLNIITMRKENQSASGVVPGGDDCFLIGGLSCSVLLLTILPSLQRLAAGIQN